MHEQLPENHMQSTAHRQAEPRLVHSRELFNNDRVVLIEHAGQTYRLLITRNDRLILHK